MAWYDSAGPAGAGFLKANQLFSEMNSREFENTLRQAQVQQLMQNMSMAPQRFGLEQQESELKRRQLEQMMQASQEKMGLDRQDFGLKQRHQTYLEDMLRQQSRPKTPSALDLLNAEEQQLTNQRLRAELPFIARGKELETIKKWQETSPEYQLLQAVAKEKEMQRIKAESTETPFVPYGSMNEMADILGPGLEKPILPYGGSSWLKPWTWPTFTGAPKYTENDYLRVLQAARRGQFKSKVPTPEQIIENLK